MLETERLESERCEERSDSSLLLLNQLETQYNGAMTPEIFAKIKRLRHSLTVFNQAEIHQEIRLADLIQNRESLVGVTFGEGEHILPAEALYWERREDEEL